VAFPTREVRAQRLCEALGAEAKRTVQTAPQEEEAMMAKKKIKHPEALRSKAKGKPALNKNTGRKAFRVGGTGKGPQRPGKKA